MKQGRLQSGKRFGIGSLLPGLAALACAVPGSAQTAPVAHWTFDEGKGQSAEDAGHPDNAAAFLNGAGWTAQGKNGGALHLNGKGSVELSHSVVDTSGSFAVSAWVKLNKLGGYQTFVSEDGGVISAFFLQLRGDTGTFALTVPGADDADHTAIAGAGFPVQTGVWYYLLGVHDAQAKTISLYVNGVFQQTTPYTSAWKATGATAIGRGKFAGKPVDFASADIDDVKMFDAATTDSTELARVAQETNANGGALTIDFTQAPRPLSPMLYGLMIEDINYSIDGGLYGELIRNRAFKDNADKPVHWSLSVLPNTKTTRLTAASESQPRLVLDTTEPIPNTALTTCLYVEPDGQEVDIVNEGYWGIPIKPNSRYRASFYAKGSSGHDPRLHYQIPAFKGPLTVSLKSADGRTVYASAVIKNISSEWKRYAVTLKTGNVPASKNNIFTITAGGSGALRLNQVSLMPETWNNRPNGTRKDLMQILADMKPAFLRLPGGNYLEGNTIAERFNWKETRGPISQRPGHQDPWGYRSDDGFGLLEYLEWCEDLHMAPVLAVFAGYALNGEHVAAGPGLTPFVQDALDEIEYVTGGTDTKWGALRAKDGHPAPFPLTYVEIGNEDMFDRSGSYDGRFAAFYDAIKAKYPKLQCIATAPTPSRKPDVLDDHYYRSADAMAGDWHHYDNYDRKGPKIFVGEWASQDIDTPWVRPNEKGPTPTMNSALGDAAWMAGMEKNSDLVVISSYAPLFVNVNPGGRQWAINLIGYDALTSYGSPSYYAQQMFSLYHGDQILPADLSGLRPLYYTASRDSKTGTIYLKVVNRMGTAQTVDVALKGLKTIGKSGKAVTLSAATPAETNTLTDPKHLTPTTAPFQPTGTTFRYTFPPYSVTALVLPAH